jgi:hypothetical protein
LVDVCRTFDLVMASIPFKPHVAENVGIFVSVFHFVTVAKGKIRVNSVSMNRDL